MYLGERSDVDHGEMEEMEESGGRGRDGDREGKRRRTGPGQCANVSTTKFSPLIFRGPTNLRG